MSLMAAAKMSVPSAKQRRADRSRPEGAPVMFQRWENLLFVHWRWDPLQVQRTLPRGLTVDTFHGGAWVGLVPMFMKSVRPSFLPAVPVFSDFFELNFRTYVYDAQGRPGVFFYSLDCNQPLVVEAARRVLNLNYVHSAIDASVHGDGFVDFRSQRVGVEVPDAFRYRPLPGNIPLLDESSLEYFLFERYRLFSASAAGELSSLRVYHASYSLHRAESIVLDPVTLRLGGFDPRGRPPDHICTAQAIDAEIFLPEPVPLVAR